MESSLNYYISDEDKDRLISQMAPELVMLRAKAEISQEEIANIIGTSRQTYGAIERRTRKMSWSTYLSLIWFFDCNRKTHKMLRSMKAFPNELLKQLNDGGKPLSFELSMLSAKDIDILGVLDEQAVSTIKTVLMVEYSRCSNMSGDTVIKMFEGVDLTKNAKPDKQANISNALKNIKRKRF